jgi:hypothetical protein
MRVAFARRTLRTFRTCGVSTKSKSRIIHRVSPDAIFRVKTRLPVRAAARRSVVRPAGSWTARNVIDRTECRSGCRSNSGSEGDVLHLEHDVAAEATNTRNLP